MLLPGKLIDMIEAADYRVTKESDDSYNFAKFSSAGQDFNFSVNTGNDIESFRNNIIEYYENFDVSYEAYLWLDDTGHGKNGAPYDMKVVYEDMSECEDFIYDLQWIVGDYITKNMTETE